MIAASLCLGCDLHDVNNDLGGAVNLASDERYLLSRAGGLGSTWSVSRTTPS